MALVEISGVNKHFGDFHALKDINLSIEQGEVVVVIGRRPRGRAAV